MSAKALELMQLADSAFPSGGFAFSNGLETLAKLGWLRRLEDFEAYLGCHLEQAASSEIPFLNSAWEAWDDPGARVPFEDLVREWDAWIVHPAQRRASLSQGQAWTRAAEAAYGAKVRRVGSAFARSGIPLHFLPAFAATLKDAGLGRGEAQALLLHASLRDQMSAAVRLGLLGSLQAQALHRAFAGRAAALLEEACETAHEDAVRTAPMIDLAQAGHPHLYSKLFQS